MEWDTQKCMAGFVLKFLRQRWKYLWCFVITRDEFRLRLWFLVKGYVLKHQYKTVSNFCFGNILFLFL